jgi:hypothetical protein
MLTFKKRLIPLAVSAAMAISYTAPALADTTGTIFGTEDPGTEITYVNTKTGSKRTLTVGSDGRFRFANVQPGVYEVTNGDGVTRTVLVTISQGAVVSFSDAEVISVRGSRILAIDTSSSESSTVFSTEAIELLPVSRDIVSVSLLTPGTNQGGDSFGRNLPSFGGSSVAENGYYIDGFDVTDLRELLGFATLPIDAVSQIEVKRGGLPAEYGRSLGGIINTVTRSGTNDWEFDATAFWRPDSLRASGRNIRTNVNDLGVATFRTGDEVDNLTYGVTAAGPIIEDTLFIMANITGQEFKRNNYSINTSSQTKIQDPSFVVKLDWQITDDHRVSGTYIDNEETDDVILFEDAVPDVLNRSHGERTSAYEEVNGGNIFIANYTGYLTDDLTLSFTYGKLESKIAQRALLDGGECARAFDTTGGRTFGQRLTIGCWNPAQSFITSPDLERRDERVGWRTDLEYNIGDHLIKAGYETQEYDSYDPGRSYTGGIYYRYFEAHPNFNNRVNGVELDEGTIVVRSITNDTLSGKFSLENTAWYIEDTWRFQEDMLAYFAVRGETFENLDSNDQTFLKSDSLIAPRFGFTWDVYGDSSAKFYATLGRYYIPVATNSNIRATRIESGSTFYNVVDGFNASDGTPINLGAQVGPGTEDEQLPNPETIADVDLKPMHQDELIVGYQQNISEDWTLGIKGMYRTIKDGMDDFCGTQGFIDWAADEGHTNFDPHTLSGCILVNPGNDIKLAIDLNGDGNLSVNTIPASYFGLPQYKRDYYALELTAEKAFSNGWSFNASYIFSRSYGNAEGYVNSTLGQEDAGATQDFDHPLFVAGSNGPLPNDRTHQIKAFGNYEINDELRAGFNMSIVQGIPLSCNGFIPESLLPDPPDGVSASDTTYDRANFRRYSASSFFCSDENGDPELNFRGAEGRGPWLVDFGASLTYKPAQVEGLALTARVFNLLNIQKGTTFDQSGDIARGDPARNPDYLQPLTYQAPRRVELSVRYKF